MRDQFPHPASVRIGIESRPGPYGPFWRTADGGALVACVAVSETTVGMGPRQVHEVQLQRLEGTTGIRWAGFTQSQLNLTMLKIPAQAAEEVSVAAKASWPLHFEGTRYTGN